MKASSIINHNNLIFIDDEIYNYNLNFFTKFNIIANIHNQKNCNKITLNWGFKDIKFDKKQMVLFFILMELFCNQKCIVTQSSKNILALRIKKGSITGCKVTLRKENLALFLETLLLGFPRSEMFKGFSFKKNTLKKNTFSTKITNLFNFFTLESELNQNINALDITFNFNTINDLEKCFFFTSKKLPLKFF